MLCFDWCCQGRESSGEGTRSLLHSESLYKVIQSSEEYMHYSGIRDLKGNNESKMRGQKS